jgi:hypothetical protein
MARVIFTVPDVEHEPGSASLGRLLEELDLLHRDGANYDGPAAAERIRRAAESGMDVVKLNLLAEWSDAERIALVRGLDHVRNTHGLDIEAQRLRAPLLAAPRTYELRSLVPREVKLTGFWSYTGDYEPGDHVVIRDGTAWTVIAVEAGDEHPRLVLDRP